MGFDKRRVELQSMRNDERIEVTWLRDSVTYRFSTVKKFRNSTGRCGYTLVFTPLFLLFFLFFFIFFRYFMLFSFVCSCMNRCELYVHLFETTSVRDVCPRMSINDIALESIKKKNVVQSAIFSSRIHSMDLHNASS